MQKGYGRKRRSLRKDLRQERRVRRTEQKGKAKFLGELITQEKLTKANAQLDKEVSVLANLVHELQGLMQQYGALIQEYLKTKDPKFTATSAAYSEGIAADLKKLFLWLQEVENTIDNDVQFIEDDLKSFRAENSLFSKEMRLEQREFRNLSRAARKKLGLHEQEKQAVIKKRQDLNGSLQNLHSQLIQMGTIILQEILHPDQETIKQLQEHRKDIKHQWEKQASNWPSLLQLLGQLREYLGKKGEFIATLAERNRKLFIVQEKMAALFQEKKKVLEEKMKYDRVYQSFLVQEQVELGHEKHMGDIVKAL